MEVVFKVADVTDIDQLVEFMGEFYEFEHLAFDEQAVRSVLQQIFNNDSLGRVWLIQVDGSPIGYVVLTLGFSLEFHGRDAFIDEIYIRTPHRGLGIGRKTLKFVEDVCSSLGVQAMHLEVERENTNGQAAYRKLGFEDQDSYLMTKWVAT